MQKSLKSVSARFGGSQEYHYLVLAGDEPSVGDLVLTSVAWADRSAGYAQSDTLKMARVVEVHETASEKATKFYLQLISRRVLDERQRLNQVEIERRKERKRVTAQLELMLREQSAADRFAKLAASNPDAAALLAKLEEL